MIGYAYIQPVLLFKKIFKRLKEGEKPTAVHMLAYVIQTRRCNKTARLGTGQPPKLVEMLVVQTLSELCNSDNVHFLALTG